MKLKRSKFKFIMENYKLKIFKIKDDRYIYLYSFGTFLLANI